MSIELAQLWSPPTLIDKLTKNPRAIQMLLGHTKLEITVRYLGIDADDAFEIAEQSKPRSKIT